MDFLFYVWQCLSFLYRPLPMKSIATFHIPHREVGMFFLHIGEVCVTHTCHSGLSELLSFFSRERPQTFLLPQRSHIASPNLQRCQVSPSLYFRGSVCRLPGFENFSSSLLVVSQNSRVPPPKCWSGPEAVPLHSKKKKKTSRNARFLEWLWPRMRQHSHGRDSCTCRLLPQFLFQRRVDCARSGFEVELLFLVIL